MSRPLVCREPMQCFMISGVLSAFLVAAATGLICLLRQYPDPKWTPAWILGCAGLGGLFGGAGRSLIMFISEIGVHRNPLSESRNPKELLSRWALYLTKPFAGVASGVLFFFAVKYGLVQALAEKSDGDPLSVFFVAAIGGVAFEEAIRLSERLAGRQSETRATDPGKQGVIAAARPSRQEGGELMLHPASQAVERYYGLFNEKDWPGIAAMFDLPAVLIVGPSKRVLEKPDAVTALYRALGEKCSQGGVVRVSWDRRSFAVFQVHDDLAIVKTVVTREGADHAPIKTWNCSYTLRLVGEKWLFALITSDDAGNANAGLTAASP